MSENRPDRRVGIEAGSTSRVSRRAENKKGEKQNAALVRAVAVLVASAVLSDSFVVTVYRHNSLNSEGGACFQVTIFRHLRRTAAAAETDARSNRDRGWGLGAAAEHRGAPLTPAARR